MATARQREVKAIVNRLIKVCGYGKGHMLTEYQIKRQINFAISTWEDMTPQGQARFVKDIQRAWFEDVNKTEPAPKQQPPKTERISTLQRSLMSRHVGSFFMNTYVNRSTLKSLEKRNMIQFIKEAFGERVYIVTVEGYRAMELNFDEYDEYELVAHSYERLIDRYGSKKAWEHLVKYYRSLSTGEKK